MDRIVNICERGKWRKACMLMLSDTFSGPYKVANSVTNKCRCFYVTFRLPCLSFVDCSFEIYIANSWISLYRIQKGKKDWCLVKRIPEWKRVIRAKKCKKGQESIEKGVNC